MNVKYITLGENKGMCEFTFDACELLWSIHFLTICVRNNPDNEQLASILKDALRQLEENRKVSYIDNQGGLQQ